jgi:hypothetical protein
MSYCRFSSDDCQCDVYCYEDVSGGWTTHVASKRVVFDVPLPPPVEYVPHAEAFFARLEAVRDIVKLSKRVPIGLPYDGESFNDPTPGEAADRLEMLRDAGYRVPQSAIDMLREEAAEVTE